MSAIRLYRNSLGDWVYDRQGNEHIALLSSVADIETFRSIGLHPRSAVSISVSSSGRIDGVSLVDGTPLEELLVPPNHSLYRDLTPV
ncbi:hypothetical protein FDI21_gp235 [Pseudomonas phage Noxifer]|uniref:Uncharacterized protein n=1 Tax=Pseudomonas phage Noxifer TaxID=2006684 RepID=A0A1Y0T0K6_9CAUD|nr:hypothetical protein FDI21_gp235 [Pseudomonas phage Noxifer]ARV77476.1 hypothetical protein NOXIFER_311 [Pseudomonas phage Noxifer]